MAAVVAGGQGAKQQAGELAAELVLETVAGARTGIVDSLERSAVLEQQRRTARAVH